MEEAFRREKSARQRQVSVCAPLSRRNTLQLRVSFANRLSCIYTSGLGLGESEEQQLSPKQPSETRSPSNCLYARP